MKINWHVFMSTMVLILGLAWLCFLFVLVVLSNKFPWWVGTSAAVALLISCALGVSVERK